MNPYRYTDMKPYRYTEKNGEIIFHYKFSELREFISNGKKYGNNGMIITKKTKYGDFYRGFGIIEYPLKSILTLCMSPKDPFTKNEINPEEIINPEHVVKGESRIIVLDLDEIKL